MGFNSAFKELILLEGSEGIQETLKINGQCQILADDVDLLGAK
jgi:hypothetical protein